MHTKLERLLSKSLTTLEVMAYYLVVHTGPDCPIYTWLSHLHLVVPFMPNCLVYTKLTFPTTS